MIYIIRHGETEWNVEKRMQGQTDILLDENGIQQAEQGSQNFKNIEINKIISSDLKRAYMTAQIINKVLNVQIETDKRLREFNYGQLEGITRDKITQETWQQFNKNPKLYNAESNQEILERIESFIDDLTRYDKSKNYLLVTHGGPIRMIDYYLDNGSNYNNEKFLNEYMTKKIKNLDIFTIDNDMKLKRFNYEK